MARACFKCGKEITACFGFVKAGDFVDCLEGRRTKEPRELCGICAELWKWTVAGDLEPNLEPFEAGYFIPITPSH